MPSRTPTIHHILASAITDTDVDDLAILREGWRRFEKELAATISDFGRLGASARDGRSGEPGYYVLLDRLEALGDLHRTLRGVPARVNIADSVAHLTLTLARCSRASSMPPIEMDLADLPIDGRVARGISLALVGLIAGETAGGPIATDGHLELEIRIAHASVELRLRDVASDPPDRVAVGGRLLRRTLDALGAKVARVETPGLATVAITVPLGDAQPFRTAGNA